MSNVFFEFFKHMQSRTYSVSTEETPFASFLSFYPVKGVSMLLSVWHVQDGERRTSSAVVRNSEVTAVSKGLH